MVSYHRRSIETLDAHDAPAALMSGAHDYSLAFIIPVAGLFIVRCDWFNSLRFCLVLLVLCGAGALVALSLRGSLSLSESDGFVLVPLFQALAVVSGVTLFNVVQNRPLEDAWWKRPPPPGRLADAAAFYGIFVLVFCVSGLGIVASRALLVVWASN